MSSRRDLLSQCRMQAPSNEKASLPSHSQIVVTLPVSISEDAARRLKEGWGDERLDRHALEGIVAQAYREGKLTIGEVRRELGHDSRQETEGFLKERGAYLDYTKEDLRNDSESIRRMREREE